MAPALARRAPVAALMVLRAVNAGRQASRLGLAGGVRIGDPHRAGRRSADRAIEFTIHAGRRRLLKHLDVGSAGGDLRGARGDENVDGGGLARQRRNPDNDLMIRTRDRTIVGGPAGRRIDQAIRRGDSWIERRRQILKAGRPRWRRAKCCRALEFYPSRVAPVVPGTGPDGVKQEHGAPTMPGRDIQHQK